LSDSDRRKPGWPEAERRSGAERRVRRDRRTAGAAQAARPLDPDSERRGRARRSGSDRRDEGGWHTVVLDAVPASPLGGEEALLGAATAARSRARAQYSRFKVGAALETVEGAVVTGCNIENATYGLTLCAERVALVKALSDGHDIFTRIVVVADTETPTPPCGACRQLLWEYCGDLDVILANPGGVTARYRLSALLPLPFDHRLL
jgi:cytidine deaminase